MKKIAFYLALPALLGLSQCGQQEAREEPTTPVAEVSTTPADSISDTVPSDTLTEAMWQAGSQPQPAAKTSAVEPTTAAATPSPTAAAEKVPVTTSPATAEKTAPVNKPTTADPKTAVAKPATTAPASTPATAAAPAKEDPKLPFRTVKPKEVKDSELEGKVGGTPYDPNAPKTAPAKPAVATPAPAPATAAKTTSPAPTTAKPAPEPKKDLLPGKATGPVSYAPSATAKTGTGEAKPAAAKPAAGPTNAALAKQGSEVLALLSELQPDNFVKFYKGTSTLDTDIAYTMSYYLNTDYKGKYIYVKRIFKGNSSDPKNILYTIISVKNDLSGSYDEIFCKGSSAANILYRIVNVPTTKTWEVYKNSTVSYTSQNGKVFRGASLDEADALYMIKGIVGPATGGEALWSVRMGSGKFDGSFKAAASTYPNCLYAMLVYEETKGK